MATAEQVRELVAERRQLAPELTRAERQLLDLSECIRLLAQLLSDHNRRDRA